MKPGIYDIGSDAYHADQLGDAPTLSSGVIRTMVAKSPAHACASHPKLSGTVKPPTKDQQERYDIGHATHSLLLEGHANNVDVFAFKDWKTKAAQEERDVCRQHGRIPMLGDKWDTLEAMVDAARTKIAARRDTPRLFTAGMAERTLVWTESGVACKARLDWLHDDHSAVDDLKTATNANPQQLGKVIADKGYHIQAGLHMRAVRALTGTTPKFRFVFVEKDPPYEIAVAELTASALALADAQIDWALETWKRCLETNVWPGYSADVCRVEIPAWEEARWLEKEAMAA